MIATARPGRAGPGMARRGAARRGMAGQGEARPGKAGRGAAWRGLARHGVARRGEALRGAARHGLARHSEAGQGAAGRGQACPGRAGHGAAWPGTAGQGETRSADRPPTCVRGRGRVGVADTALRAEANRPTRRVAHMATKAQRAAIVPSWFRRPVPAGYVEALLRLDGRSPLLMNNGERDPDADESMAYEALAQVRKKSREQQAQLRRLEWSLRLYHDEELGPYLPSKNLHELLRSAAAKWRKGQDVLRSVVIVEYRLPLQYDGPRDQDGMWDAGFRYTTMVANAGAGSGRVQRCRPMFSDWAIDATLAFDPEDIDLHMLELIVERTQKYGIGDYRAEKGGGFGAFAATLTDVVDHMPDVQPNGHSVFDEDAAAAHKVRVDGVRRG